MITNVAQVELTLTPTLPHSHTPILCPPHRAGIALIYASLLMLILAGLVAFAVDLGRVHLVKTELQAAADAAAHAAAWRIPDQDLTGNGSTSGYSVAKAVALRNTADGENAVVLDTTKSDVEFGFWSLKNRTFTKAASPTDFMQANAVHVTAWRSAARSDAVSQDFAPAIGGAKSTDLSAEAIAMVFGSSITGGHGYGIFGRVSVTLKGNGSTDSYDPAKGAYGGSNVGKDGGVATNGYISMNGNANIQGDARWGAEASNYAPNGTYLSGGSVTGWQGRLDDVITYPTVPIPTSYDNNPISSLLTGGGALKTLSKGGKLPAGTYYVGGISMSGQSSLTVTGGTVTIYVNGNVDLSGGSVISYNNNPANLIIKVIKTTGSSVTLHGKGSIYAHVYAPDSDITLTGNGDIFGTVIGNSINAVGNGAIHYDDSLTPFGNPNDGKFTVQLVK